MLLIGNRWEKTHALLVEGGLTYDDIRKSVTNARIAFREGVIELFEFLEVIFNIKFLLICLLLCTFLLFFLCAFQLPNGEPCSLVPDDEIENHLRMIIFPAYPSQSSFC